MNREQEEAIYDVLRRRHEVIEVRFRTDGGVDAYGPMPNSNIIGWWFAGWDFKILAESGLDKTQSKETVDERPSHEEARALALDLRIQIEDQCKRLEALGKNIGISRDFATGELHIVLADKL